MQADTWLCVAAQELLICCCWPRPQDQTFVCEADRFLGAEMAGAVWLAHHHKALHLFHPCWETDDHPPDHKHHCLPAKSSLLFSDQGIVGGGGGGMAAAVSFSRVQALPTWSSSVSGSGSGDDHHSYPMLAMSARPRSRSSARPLRSPTQMMGNVNEGKGLFAPLVVVARNIIGRKRFNQLRGKAIALHSQVITEFCKTIGADAKQRQGLIRLAKKNGEKLGFLA